MNAVDFERLRAIVGFEDYDAEAERYRVEDERPPGKNAVGAGPE